MKPSMTSKYHSLKARQQIWTCKNPKCNWNVIKCLITSLNSSNFFSSPALHTPGRESFQSRDRDDLRRRGVHGAGVRGKRRQTHHGNMDKGRDNSTRRENCMPQNFFKLLSPTPQLEPLFCTSIPCIEATRKHFLFSHYIELPCFPFSSFERDVWFFAERGRKHNTIFLPGVIAFVSIGQDHEF